MELHEKLRGLAEEFKYEYLATKIAEETCKRLMIIENNRKEKQTQENKEE